MPKINKAILLYRLIVFLMFTKLFFLVLTKFPSNEVHEVNYLLLIYKTKVKYKHSTIEHGKIIIQEVKKYN